MSDTMVTLIGIIAVFCLGLWSGYSYGVRREFRRMNKAFQWAVKKKKQLEKQNEALQDALQMIEWMPIHDPDTHEVLGQVCYWCHRKPHTSLCKRQAALLIREDGVTLKEIKDTYLPNRDLDELRCGQND